MRIQKTRNSHQELKKEKGMVGRRGKGKGGKERRKEGRERGKDGGRNEGREALQS